MPLTAKERAWKIINDIPAPEHKADVREYVQWLEHELGKMRVERNNLRDPRGGNY